MTRTKTPSDAGTAPTRLSSLGQLVASQLPIPEGTQVGAYRLIEQIGAGGMGAVWLAEHALIGRCAAIKLLHASFSCRPEVVARFFNEARAATAIADPGIVQIFDFGHHTDGTAYIVMELLDGETLHDRCRAPISIPQALRIVRQVASSLGAAHACGIVHRDLKPENIFLVRDPEVPGGERAKILDFGIAKLATDPGHKTLTSMVMGTPAFMSPEQCRGIREIDARSDIYSLGCVLFSILVGREPFDAECVGDLIIKHVTEAPPIASSLAPRLPPAVDALIARCLEKDPARRFESGAALAAAIGALLEHLPLATVPPHAAGPLVAPPTTLSTAIVAVSAPTTTRGRRSFVVGSVLGIAATAIVALSQLPGRQVTVEPAISVPAAPRVVEPVFEIELPIADLAKSAALVLRDGFSWINALAALTPAHLARSVVRPLVVVPGPNTPPAMPAPTPAPTESPDLCAPDAQGIPVCR